MHSIAAPIDRPFARARRDDSPRDLFAAGGVKGAWFESDWRNCDQTPTPSAAVTASGDPVGYLADLSGNGNHLFSDGTGDRFTAALRDGRRVIRSDGSASKLRNTGLPAMSAVGVLCIGAYVPTPAVATDTLVHLAAATAADSEAALVSRTVQDDVRMDIRTTATIRSQFPDTDDAWAVYTFILESGNTSARANGLELLAWQDTFPTSDITALALGATTAGADHSIFDLSSLVLCETTLSAALLDRLERYTAGRMGIVL